MAFRYLGMLFFPLAVGYCIYSVIYNEHKSWYSFILTSCYGFLLTFGFIMMTPQEQFQTRVRQNGNKELSIFSFWRELAIIH